MGFQEAAGGGGGIRRLMRRKQVDSDRPRAAAGGQQLAKELSVTQLIAIGALLFLSFLDFSCSLWILDYVGKTLLLG